MASSSLAIPTTIATPRCFVLEPVINETQAHSQAGEHKSRVFGFDARRVLGKITGKSSGGHEIALIERRLVAFWHIRCKSHFDYIRLRDYTISAYDPDAVSISVQGTDTTGGQVEMLYRVDQTGRSGGQVKLTGNERCVTDRDVTDYIDSYTRTEDWQPRELDQHQKRLAESAKQRPRPVVDLEAFATELVVDGRPLFQDNIRTIVVPPLEAADSIVRRTLQRVIVPIEAATIHEWSLEVMNIDLYFRPLYVFQFERLDQDGNPTDRKLEELDALNRDRWVVLQTTEFQMSTIPWFKILKLSADIGSIMLRDVPILGTTLQVTNAVLDQGPGIIDDLKGRS